MSGIITPRHGIPGADAREADDMLEAESHQLLMNPHPLDYLRINTVVQQFPQFLETYGITEGDGMYLAPENSVQVW